MPSDWKKFAQDYAFLFGGAAGACLTFIFLGLKQLFGRPRLHLVFNKDDEAYLSESTHLEGETPKVMVTRKYLRVSVQATGIFRSRSGGSSGARKCRIYVTSIQPIKDGKPQHDRIYDARPTSWPPRSLRVRISRGFGYPGLRLKGSVLSPLVFCVRSQALAAKPLSLSSFRRSGTTPPFRNALNSFTARSYSSIAER